MRLQQKDYRGTINVTRSGRTCQRWDAQTPHTHSNDPSAEPLAGLEDNNFCRNPDFDEGAWCYTTDPEVRWEYCDVPACHDNFVPRRYCGTTSQNQMDYRGGVEVTETGALCSGWDSDIDGRFNSEDVPTAGLVGTTCRNPPGSGRTRAWCYTSNSESNPWEYCNVDECKECGTASPTIKKTDYRGDIHVSTSGKPCREWSGYDIRMSLLGERWNDANVTDDEESLIVAQMHETADFYAQWGLEGSYCRNPNGAQDDVWCYVENDEDGYSNGTSSSLAWEYCDVPTCSQTELACGSLGENESGYRGMTNVTISGLPCQRWDSQVPHDHKFRPGDRPSDGLDENYCRNPDNSDKAWCYTTDPNVLWEYCNITECYE